MKKRIGVFLALLLLLAMFSGCGSGKTTQGGGAATAAPTPTEAEDEGPYHLAKGKFSVDERGVPLEKYTYDVPLTTSDEVFTYWTGILIPDYIDSENYAGMPYPTLLRETTGVHLEYMLVAGETRAQNCSVLVASDSLPDLLSDLNYYYPGTMQSALEDGYIANIYQYRDYTPNYTYCVYSHEDDRSVRAQLMADSETIYYFRCLNDTLKTTWGGAVRGDWVEDLGLSIDDILTFDDLHNLLLAFQSQKGAQYPFLLLNTLDPHSYWSGFETICNYNATVAPAYVKDGKVQFACSGENDFSYMSTLNEWYNDGLISPNWMSRSSNNDLVHELVNGEIGLLSMVPSEQYGYVDPSVDPDACWKAIHKPVRYEGQVFHLGNVASWVQFGSWSISAKCENIPLLASYCDYFYSDEGVIVSNWGVEN